MNFNNSRLYDIAWFKERAVNSLKKLGDGVWDFSDSLLLYTPAGSDTYEQLQNLDTPYYRLVTKPERAYLQSIAKDVVSLLPDHFDYIDLGPGTEHKEQFFFDELKKQGKRFTYIPVDISSHFLEMAQTYAGQQEIESFPVRASFEELPELLVDRHAPRFVSLGLTFSNYNPQDALTMLSEIAGKDGWIFINAQMRDRVDMIELQKVYQNDAVAVADEKVQLLDIDPIADISQRVADDGFRVWCTVKKASSLLYKIGLREGDRLLVFQSLRYTKPQLQKVVEAFPNHRLFDTGASFISAMIHT